ncbi:hypothetical protein [Thalassotalea sp. ND16A]|uniref:hypothetical protein n=1 Tax=Thalassotalea sp. ND16A TaxID=1535422 RepID=UPI00051A3662|nr:hypothetical protein [Thalassotalea sp. ND16A]KGJ97151.1 hypothetical protein ND16A_0073 [Thalassotalea sp. ND16A]
MKNNNLKTKLTTAAAIVAMTVGVNQAFANTSAKTTIFNKVDVTYTSVNSSTPKTATDVVSVDVAFVDAAAILTPSELTDGSLSGLYQTIYTIDAQANGSSDYLLSSTPVEGINIEANSASSSLHLVTSATDAVTAAPVTGVTLGSAVIVDINDTTDTLTFPGGTLEGFADDDTVVVYVSGTATVFEVVSFVVGNAPSYNAGTEVLTAEIQDTMVLRTVGGGAADLSTLSVGDVIGERKFLRLDTTAINSHDTDDGIVTADLNVETDEAGDGSGGGLTGTGADQTLTYKASSVTVDKLVKLSTEPDTSYAITVADGASPGNTLDYKVTVSVTAGLAESSAVTVTDILPLYTKYVPLSLAVNYTNTPDTLDADATNTLDVVSGTQVEGEYDDNGTASDYTDDTIVIHLGNGATTSAGGVMKGSDVVTITYSVTVD